MALEIWFGLVLYGIVWYGMVWYGLVWIGIDHISLYSKYQWPMSSRKYFGLVWYCTVWFGMVWFGMAWYGPDELMQVDVRLQKMEINQITKSQDAVIGNDSNLMCVLVAQFLAYLPKYVLGTDNLLPDLKPSPKDFRLALFPKCPTTHPPTNPTTHPEK